jgi:hypothetical protein
MAKHTFTGHLFLHAKTAERGGNPYYHFSQNDISGDGNFIKVVDCAFDVEIPDDFNPTPALVAALDAEERALRLKLADQLMHIHDRRSKLQAICYEAATA